MSGDDAKPSLQQGLTYRDAGVDIEAGDRLVEIIAPLAKSTDRAGTMGGLGGFGALFDLKAAGFDDPILVAGTDGVGTKLKIAIESGQHQTVGIDLVAMCVNDLLVQGATPLLFLDYYASGELKVAEAAAVVAGIAEGCRQAGCALVGGETAELPGLYAAGDYDLAGFALGAVERGALLPRDDIAAGDCLIGIASDGLHSNGFSLARRVVSASGLNWDDPAPFDPSRGLAEALLTPTRIYVPALLPLVGQGKIKAMAHITGGGLPGNLPRVLPASLIAEVAGGSWPVPPVFGWLKRTGAIDALEMQRTFNCGIGMVLIVAEAEAEACLAALAEAGSLAARIGRLAERGSAEMPIRIAPEAIRWHG